MSAASHARAVIVGAGPVGMVCALALNRRGVPVTVFEQEPAPVTDQRAASIHPTTLELLDNLGVTQKILPLGLKSPSYRFHDRVSGAMIAEFDLGLMRDEFRFPFVLQYEQYKLTASIRSSRHRQSSPRSSPPTPRAGATSCASSTSSRTEETDARGAIEAT